MTIAHREWCMGCTACSLPLNLLDYPCDPRIASPDFSPYPVKTRTASPLDCLFIEVSNPDRRAGDAETNLYRSC